MCMHILLCCSSFFLFFSHSSNIMSEGMLSHPVLTLMSLTFPEWDWMEHLVICVWTVQFGEQ